MANNPGFRKLSIDRSCR